MKINDQIKQEKFASSKQKSIINLIYTFNYFDSNMRQILSKYDILYQHYNVLKILKGAKGTPLTHTQILNVMLDKTRDLTRLIDKLENKGYVKRKVNQENKRSVFINLTDGGLEKTLEIEKDMEKWVESANFLSESESEKISDLMDKMRG
jgi:DNA-binding MarR family transcriptional regulator